MRILINIDHKWRDLPGNTWLGMKLRAKGHEVVFCRQSMEAGALWNFKPDAIVVNHVLDPKRRALLQVARSYGVRTAVLFTEGIPAFAKIPDLDPERLGTRDSVDLHMVWNREYHDYLQKMGWPERSIAIIGVPRFDFYAPPLNSLIPNRADFARQWDLDPGLPTVTFTTNFTHARYHVLEKEVLEKDYEKLGVRRAMDQHGDIARRDHDSREIFTRALKEFPGRMPGVNIILRPHPGEDHDYWERTITEIRQSHPQARIAKIIQSYIWDVLANTDVLVARSCTTGVEAWMLNLPTLENGLNPDEWYLSEQHAAGSDVVTTLDSMVERIRFYLGKGAIDQRLLAARATFSDRWCGPGGGRSTDRAADALDGLLSESPGASYPTSVRGFMKRVSYKFQALFDHRIHDIMTGTSGGLDHRGRMDKWVHWSDIKDWETRLQPFQREMNPVALVPRR